MKKTIMKKNAIKTAVALGLMTSPWMSVAHAVLQTAPTTQQTIGTVGAGSDDNETNMAMIGCTQPSPIAATGAITSQVQGILANTLSITTNNPLSDCDTKGLTRFAPLTKATVELVNEKGDKVFLDGLYKLETQLNALFYSAYEVPLIRLDEARTAHGLKSSQVTSLVRDYELKFQSITMPPTGAANLMKMVQGQLLDKTSSLNGLTLSQKRMLGTKISGHFSAKLKGYQDAFAVYSGSFVNDEKTALRQQFADQRAQMGSFFKTPLSTELGAMTSAFGYKADPSVLSSAGARSWSELAMRRIVANSPQNYLLAARLAAGGIVTSGESQRIIEASLQPLNIAFSQEKVYSSEAEARRIIQRQLMNNAVKKSSYVIDSANRWSLEDKKTMDYTLTLINQVVSPAAAGQIADPAMFSLMGQQLQTMKRNMASGEGCLFVKIGDAAPVSDYTLLAVTLRNAIGPLDSSDQPAQRIQFQFNCAPALLGMMNAKLLSPVGVVRPIDQTGAFSGGGGDYAAPTATGNLYNSTATGAVLENDRKVIRGDLGYSLGGKASSSSGSSTDGALVLRPGERTLSPVSLTNQAGSL